MELWFPRMELLLQESPFRIGDVTATISVSGSGQTIGGNPVVVFVRAALVHERCYLDGPSPENLPRSKSAPRTGFSLASFLAGPRDTTGPETSASPLRPRFNAACPNSPGADRPMPVRNACTCRPSSGGVLLCYAQWHSICHLGGRDHSVQPVLLLSQGPPGLFHSLEAAKRRLIDCNLGKVRTTISVLKEGVGLFHCVSSYALKPF